MYGNKIKQLRKKAGLSQAELAAQIGISRPNISFWENSPYPPLEAIDRVCAALHVNIGDFFNDQEGHSRDMVPEDLRGLVGQLQLFDDDTKKDLLEIFGNILQKYGKSKLAGKDHAPRAAMNGRDRARMPLKEQGSAAKPIGIKPGDELFVPWSARFYIN